MIHIDHNEVSALLLEWSKYNAISHTNKASFVDAIDIEVERTSLAVAVNVFYGLLEKTEFTEDDVEIMNDFKRRLEKFKGLITMELLRNGTYD